MEQNYLITDQNEEDFIHKITMYRYEIEKENRVNAELVAYINENQKDMEAEIEMWMKRYDTELEEKAIQLTKTIEDRANQKQRYEQMLIGNTLIP